MRPYMRHPAPRHPAVIPRLTQDDAQGARYDVSGTWHHRPS